jgi:hypothetical protein
MGDTGPDLGAPGYQRVPRGQGLTRVSKIEMTGYERIIDSVFTINRDKVFEEVRAFLRFEGNPSQMSYGELVDELNQAQETAVRALQLVANANATLANYLGDVEIIKAELHEQAKIEMNAKWKDPADDEVTTKPTIADVEAYKVSTYHDEWADITRRVTEAKQTVAFIEGLAKRASERARDLRDMASNARGVS